MDRYIRRALCTALVAGGLVVVGASAAYAAGGDLPAPATPEPAATAGAEASGADGGLVGDLVGREGVLGSLVDGDVAGAVAGALGDGGLVDDLLTGVPPTEIDEPGAEPGTDEPGTDEPGTDEPGTDEPGTDEPGTGQPGIDPGTGEPGVDLPGVDTPGTGEPGTDEPGTDEPGTDEPGTGRPGADPVTGEPGVVPPGGDRPAPAEPENGSHGPGADAPETDRPGTDHDDTEQPGTDRPGTEAGSDGTEAGSDGSGAGPDGADEADPLTGNPGEVELTSMITTDPGNGLTSPSAPVAGSIAGTVEPTSARPETAPELPEGSIDLRWGDRQPSGEATIYDGNLLPGGLSGGFLGPAVEPSPEPEPELENEAEPVPAPGDRTVRTGHMFTGQLSLISLLLGLGIAVLRTRRR